MRPRRLKLSTHMENVWMYRVYRNHAAALIRPFIHFSFSPIFKHKKFSSHFSQELWGLEDWNLLVHTWTVGRCIVYTGIRLLLHICPLISSFFFPIFKHWNFSSRFSQELWGLEGWNLVHTWTEGRYIVYTGIRLLLLIHPFIFHLSYSSDSAIAGL